MNFKKFAPIFILLSALFLLSFSIAENQLEKDILKETNKFRKSRGKKEFVWSDELSAIARQHSEKMAKGEIPFGHKDFNLREKEARKKLGKKLSAMAENVAYGSTTAKEVTEGWKNSPGHRQNLLGNYSLIGIGTATSGKGVIYYTQIFAE